VLDSLTDDEDVPQLEEQPVEESEPEPASEETEPSADEGAGEGDGEAAIDEALANLESELDDIDVDELADDDKKEE